MMEIDERIRTVKPFWGHGRAAILESAVDQTEHSGIVIPIGFDGDDGVKRGVLVDVALATEFVFPDDPEPLAPGTVVYYRGGVKILDVVIVDLEHVIAYEA